MKLPVESPESVPNCIIVEIAEYATGELKRCGNPMCDEQVVVLGMDNTTEEGAESYNPEHALYLYDSEENVFYCDSCQYEVYWCEPCKRCAPEWDCEECDQCGKVILDCGPFVESQPFCLWSKKWVCSICSRTACNNCDFDGINGYLNGPHGYAYHCKKCLRIYANKGRVSERDLLIIKDWLNDTPS